MYVLCMYLRIVFPDMYVYMYVCMELGIYGWMRTCTYSTYVGTYVYIYRLCRYARIYV